MPREHTSPQWLEAGPGVRTAVILGEGAGDVAADILGAGGPPPVYEDDDISVLATTAPPVDLSEAGFAGLPAGWADLIVARRPWRGVREVEPVIDEAYRVLRPSGRVVLADLDVGELSRRGDDYPLAVLCRVSPGLMKGLAGAAVAGSSLAVEANRAGFESLRQGLVDEIFGRHDEIQRLFDAVAARRMPDDPDAAAAAAAAGLLPRALPPLIDREPWSVVTGAKR